MHYDTTLKQVTYRRLTADEVATLKAGGNYSNDWSNVLVADPFDATCIERCRLYGAIRIGALAAQYRDDKVLMYAEGIRDSTLMQCTLGDHVYIDHVGYLAYYRVGDGCLLSNIGELVGEPQGECCKRWIDVVNENGRRRILPFAGMTVTDAYLWARYRGHPTFIQRLTLMTEAARCHGAGLNQIGDAAEVRHCHTIKRVAILSTAAAPTRVVGCTHLADGVVGVGNRVEHGVIADRFLLGENVHLAYGARLNDSVVGDNSTLERCEVGSSLLFPAHEQHHNNSFLIAALVGGQSNVAAGATIGSNHNSRTADGELTAERGFWPGLCVSLKHNSRFAAYCLLAKGDYPAELSIPLPFALVSNNVARQRLEVMPAYWWLYNMYALQRNEHKYAQRDRRTLRSQHIEYSPWAPDIAEEIFAALQLLGRYAAADAATRRSLTAGFERGDRDVVLLKVDEATHAYSTMMFYYCVKTLCDAHGEQYIPHLSNAQRVREWDNLGGQLVRRQDTQQLVADVEDRLIVNWQQLHDRLDWLWAAYPMNKVQHAVDFLAAMQHHDADATGAKTLFATEAQWQQYLDVYHRIQDDIRRRVQASRRKDDDNPFRHATSLSDDEYRAVYGDDDAQP